MKRSNLTSQNFHITQWVHILAFLSYTVNTRPLSVRFNMENLSVITSQKLLFGGRNNYFYPARLDLDLSANKLYRKLTKLEEELDLSAVYEYIKVKFQKKLSTIKLTSKKGADNVINCKKKKSIIKASVDEYLPTNKKQKTNDIQSPLERLDYLPKFSDFYDHNDTPKSVDNHHWDMYSMIHNLFESFNLVVYSGSHLIDTGKETHWMSRVVLKFPEEANFLFFSMVILFILVLLVNMRKIQTQ